MSFLAINRRTDHTGVLLNFEHKLVLVIVFMLFFLYSIDRINSGMATNPPYYAQEISKDSFCPSPISLDCDSRTNQHTDNQLKYETGASRL